MKDIKKTYKKIAQQIVELEKKCKDDAENQNKYMAQMQQLIEGLSLEELLQLDEYIVSRKLLKK